MKLESIDEVSNCPMKDYVGLTTDDKTRIRNAVRETGSDDDIYLLITVLPGENGQIIEIKYKKKGTKSIKVRKIAVNED